MNARSLVIDDVYDVPGLTQRFWRYVEKTDECWYWRRACNEFGYGVTSLSLRANRRRVKLQAHRLAYLLTYGVLPAGAIILHSCDRPSCVNPAHLDFGSYGDNMDDMVRKGHHRGGQRAGGQNSRARLTEYDVLTIRDRYARKEATRRDLALDFGVSIHTVRDIVRRRRWTHI